MRNSKPKKVNSDVQFKLSSKLAVVKKLASYFVIPKEKVIEDSQVEADQQDTGYVYIPLLSEVGFNKLLFTVHADNIPLDMLVSGRLKDTMIYTAFIQAELETDPTLVSDLLMTVEFKSSCWVLFRDYGAATDYPSCVLLNDSSHDKHPYLLFMPLTSYLRHYFPVQNEG